MVYTCFYVFATVVSYVINTVAYSDAGEILLAGVSAIGAILVLCKYLYFNIFSPLRSGTSTDKSIKVIKLTWNILS